MEESLLMDLLSTPFESTRKGPDRPRPVAAEALESRTHLSASLPAAPPAGPAPASGLTAAPLQTAATPGTIHPAFNWSLPHCGARDPKDHNLIELPNSFAYVNPAGFTLRLDASATKADAPIVSYHWLISGNGLKTPIFRAGSTPLTSITGLAQGEYSVLLTVRTSGGRVESVTQSVRVRDILIVSLGDSYASGEGNPEVRVRGARGALG